MAPFDDSILTINLKCFIKKCLIFGYKDYYIENICNNALHIYMILIYDDVCIYFNTNRCTSGDQNNIFSFFVEVNYFGKGGQQGRQGGKKGEVCIRKK